MNIDVDVVLDEQEQLDLSFRSVSLNQYGDIIESLKVNRIACLLTMHPFLAESDAAISRLAGKQTWPKCCIISCRIIEGMESIIMTQLHGTAR